MTPCISVWFGLKSWIFLECSHDLQFVNPLEDARQWVEMPNISPKKTSWDCTSLQAYAQIQLQHTEAHADREVLAYQWRRFHAITNLSIIAYVASYNLHITSVGQAMNSWILSSCLLVSYLQGTSHEKWEAVGELAGLVGPLQEEFQSTCPNICYQIIND